MSEYDVLSVPVADGRLTVGRWSGDPGAPVVLAAHGITANHLCWAAVARALEGAVTLVAPDLRGRGGSNGLPAPYGMRAHAEDLVAILDHLGIDRAPLIGHSMGAFVATTAAVSHPERFSQVVLVDGGLALAVPPAADVDAMLEAVIGPAMARLSMTFPTREAYREFWRAHPAFAHDWSEEVDAYVQYDLVGAEPALQSSCSLNAVRTDGADIMLDSTVVDAIRSLPAGGVLLRAPRGLQDEPRGLYDDRRIAELDLDVERTRVEMVPDVNHYTILFAEHGARAVAQQVLGSGSQL